MKTPLHNNPQIANQAVGGAKRPSRFQLGQWLPVLPFFVFSGLFLIGPTLMLAYRSLETPEGKKGPKAMSWKRNTKIRGRSSPGNTKDPVGFSPGREEEGPWQLFVGWTRSGNCRSCRSG